MLDLLRILVAILLLMHGLTHVLWFLASWTSVRTGVGDGPWLLPGDVTIRSPIGKVQGLLALVAVAVFGTAAMLLFADLPGWTTVANLGVFISIAAVLPWVRQAPGSWGITTVLADIVVMFLLALPLSVDLTA